MLGLAPSVVAEMLPSEILEAYTVRRIYDTVVHERKSYEAQRYGAYISLLPHVKKGSLKSPQTDFPLPWEKKEKQEAKPLTREERIALRAKFDANWKNIE